MPELEAAVEKRSPALLLDGCQRGADVASGVGLLK
jgi:hypothetical protein